MLAHIGASWLEPRVREIFKERGLPVPVAPERARWSRIRAPDRLDLASDRLIFDPDTGALLAAEDVALPRNGFGYQAGETLGYATYTSGIAEAIGERPPHR